MQVLWELIELNYLYLRAILLRLSQVLQASLAGRDHDVENTKGTHLKIDISITKITSR